MGAGRAGRVGGGWHGARGTCCADVARARGAPTGTSWPARHGRRSSRLADFTPACHPPQRSSPSPAVAASRLAGPWVSSGERNVGPRRHVGAKRGKGAPHDGSAEGPEGPLHSRAALGCGDLGRGRAPRAGHAAGRRLQRQRAAGWVRPGARGARLGRRERRPWRPPRPGGKRAPSRGRPEGVGLGSARGQRAGRGLRADGRQARGARPGRVAPARVARRARALAQGRGGRRPLGARARPSHLSLSAPLDGTRTLWSSKPTIRAFSFLMYVRASSLRRRSEWTT